jgi:glycine amidinotransferase
MTNLINAWTEFGKLETMIVGDATNGMFDVQEPAKIPKSRSGAPFPIGMKSQAIIDKANIQLDNFANMLQEEGVTIYRPDKSMHASLSQPLQTPHWKVESGYCYTCPRDTVMIVGNEIIEATMSRRARAFESFGYRDTLLDLYKRDPNALFTSAPKCTMTSNMYRPDFWTWTNEERYKRMYSSEFNIKNDEIIFDAADAMRVGADCFVVESMTTNKLGVDWLRRHLAPKGVRVHAIHVLYDLFSTHLDCTFVPIRRDLVLINPERPVEKETEILFKRNGWKFLTAPMPSLPHDAMPEHCQSSSWLSMNVLSLSEKSIAVASTEKELQKLLEDNGFDVVQVDCFDWFEFGGGLHCATLDVKRDDAKTDYFSEWQPETATG